MWGQAMVDIEMKKRSYLLVEVDGALVGEGLVDKSGHQYVTLSVALLSRACGLGIGGRLMLVLEDEARKLGAKRMFLAVWSANERAIHLYLKVGYREISRLPEWVLLDSGKTCDWVEMIKEL